MAFYHQVPVVGFQGVYWSAWVPLQSLAARLKAQNYGHFSPGPGGRILRSLLERMGPLHQGSGRTSEWYLFWQADTLPTWDWEDLWGRKHHPGDLSTRVPQRVRSRGQFPGEGRMFSPENPQHPVSKSFGVLAKNVIVIGILHFQKRKMATKWLPRARISTITAENRSAERGASIYGHPRARGDPN